MNKIKKRIVVFTALIAMLFGSNLSIFASESNAITTDEMNNTIVIIDGNGLSDDEIRNSVINAFETEATKVEVNETQIETPSARELGYWQTNTKTTYYGDIFHFIQATLKAFVNPYNLTSGQTVSFSSYNNGVSVASYYFSNVGTMNLAVHYYPMLNSTVLGYYETLTLF